MSGVRSGVPQTQQIQDPMVEAKHRSLDVTVMDDPALRRANDTVITSHSTDYRAVIEASRDGFWLLDTSGLILDVNDTYAQLSGFSKAELIGMHFSQLATADHEITAMRLRHIMRGEDHLCETQHRRKDGSVWDAEVVTRYSHDSGGQFYVFIRDISERLRVQQQLHLTAEVFENANEAIVITDADNTILRVNKSYCDVTGYSEEEVIGKTPSVLQSGRHDEDFYQQMWQSLREKGNWVGEIWDKRKNGEIYPKWLSITAVHNRQGQLTNYVGTFSDISVLKGIESELKKLAYYDALTGLPNRTLFKERLQEELNRCQRFNCNCSVLFIDLDRFKLINDTMGHASGDELLIEVSRRIRNSLRTTDTFARMGGDEFTLLLPNIPNADAVAHVAQNIIELLNEPVLLNGEEIRVGCSIGIAIYPDDGDNLETLTRHADTAMYVAKANGRGQYHFFSANMDQIAHEHLRLESELHHALERGEFFLQFQPQVDARTEKVVRCEALIRWQHPERGIVSPALFIPIAEDSDLILQIGEFVIRDACRQISEWRANGVDVPPVAINLSARQFRQSDLVFNILNILNEYQLGVDAIEFEITESVAMENAASTMHRLSMLAGEGFSLAIDDFGTGYSSLSYLKTYPVNKLKLDRSFVMDIPDDTNDAAISSAVIRMAHSLGMEVIAEGVETIEQVAFLLEEECTIMQGYHFSKPLAAEDYILFLQNR